MLNSGGHTTDLIRAAWQLYEPELRCWLMNHHCNKADSEDLLQDVFEKAMLQGDSFCSIANPRAWLFRVMKNRLIDSHKLSRDLLVLPDDLVAVSVDSEVVDELSECLPRVLSELSEEDREIIRRCDLEGMSQQEYAVYRGISLPAAKSRLRRARLRLKHQLQHACQVRLGSDGHVCCFVPRPALK